MACPQEGRNYGVDALRIVSMWMVVALHIMGQGGVISKLTPLTAKYEAVWLLETFAFCAVNCYALISGFVGLYSKFKLSNLLYLWLQVFFYSALISLAFFLIAPEKAGIKELVKSVFPVMFDQYWYFTAYFALFFFTPFLNYLIRTLSKRSATQLIISLIIVFSFIPTIRHADIFYTQRGYSAVWLAALYLIGAYIKKYGIYGNVTQRKWAIIYVIFALVSWGARWLIEGLTIWKLGGPHMGQYLTEYTSPTILGSAFALFMLFSNMKIDHAVVRRIIRVCAPLSFGIYLIHTHPLIWDHVIFNAFLSYAQKPLMICLLYIVITALGIIIACMAVDAGRKTVFDLIRVRERCNILQKRITNRWNRWLNKTEQI